jgi:hypothetical protein
MARDTGKLDDDIDALFKLPLAEFTAARNALSVRLKKSGQTNDANLVKTLSKPSVTAWAVNQLYWKHRNGFDRLMAAGQRLRKLQSSGISGKMNDMRSALDERRAALNHLSELTTSLMGEAEHSPTPDAIHRVTTSLEALSSLALGHSDGPTPGRLTQDVAAMGFESLTAFGGFSTERVAQAAKKSAPIVEKPKKGAAKSGDDAQRLKKLEQERQQSIAAAKSALQFAKKSMMAAKVKAQSLEAAHKKANSEVKEAEKRRNEAEKTFKRLSEAASEAIQRAESIAADLATASQAMADAKRAVDTETKELERLFRS